MTYANNNFKLMEQICEKFYNCKKVHNIIMLFFVTMMGNLNIFKFVVCKLYQNKKKIWWNHCFNCAVYYEHINLMEYIYSESIKYNQKIYFFDDDYNNWSIFALVFQIKSAQWMLNKLVQNSDKIYYENLQYFIHMCFEFESLKD